MTAEIREPWLERSGSRAVVPRCDRAAVLKTAARRPGLAGRITSGGRDRRWSQPVAVPGSQRSRSRAGVTRHVDTMRRSAQYCLIQMIASPAPQTGSSTPRSRASPGSASAKTTLDDVAREAGCARATVYRCFPGKQPLFGAVLDREVAALGDAVARGRGRADTLADAVVAVILTGAARSARARRARFVLAHEPEILAPAARRSSGGARCSRAAAASLAPAFTRFRRRRPRRAARRVGRPPHALVSLQPVRARRLLDDPAACARSSTTSCCPG